VPAPAPPPVIEAAPPPRLRSLIGEDIEPTVEVLKTNLVELRVGGLVQVHVVPWAGDEALIENGDVATRAGFRLRRVRFGFESVFDRRLGIILSLNPLESDTEGGTISDAKITYDYESYVRLAFGAGKVPFARGALISSRRLTTIERPLSVLELTPARRLGVTAEGRLWEEKIGFLAGLMNATEGFALGNRFGGVLAGGRLEFAPISEVSIGGSGLFEEGPAVQTLALTFDIYSNYRGFSLALEALCDRKTPIDAPEVAPGVAGAVERCGAYAELGYLFSMFGPVAQVVLRGEIFDDNRALEDTGDALLLTAGLNVDVFGELARAQLHYVGRFERHGGRRNNDVVVLAVQGGF
jgi:hypothetical protein